MLVILTTAGEEITTTADHPFYVKNHGFVNASELFIGDKLLDSNGNILLVEDVKFETATEPTTVYNFQVEDFHTYYVGGCGVLVHNAEYAPRRPVSGVKEVNQKPDGSTTYTKDVNGKDVSVTYSKSGEPDFSPYAESPKVDVKSTDNRPNDYKNANQALRDKGITHTKSGEPIPTGRKSSDGTICHHEMSGEKMQLIDSNVHRSFPHTGGVSNNKYN